MVAHEVVDDIDITKWGIITLGSMHVYPSLFEAEVSASNSATVLKYYLSCLYSGPSSQT